MTGEEYIKTVCSKANVQNSELLDIYNSSNKSIKNDMFKNMVDSIIKIKEENNSENNSNVDIYAALVCIERLSEVIDNMRAYNSMVSFLQQHIVKQNELKDLIDNGASTEEIENKANELSNSSKTELKEINNITGGGD